MLPTRNSRGSNDLKLKYTIRAPFEGLVTRKLTEVGEWVTQGQPIMEVVQLNPIELKINVPQKHLARLQQSLGAATPEHPVLAKIKIEGYDEPLTGTVERIISAADLLSRTFPVRINIDNPSSASGYLLQPGMIGTAELIIGRQTDRLMVKKDALVITGEDIAVFKIASLGEQTTVQRVSVKVGDTIEDWIQVTGDLAADEQVVLMGNERLRSGQEVRITKVIEEQPDQ